MLQSIADSLIALRRSRLISSFILDISYKASSLVKGVTPSLPYH